MRIAVLYLATALLVGACSDPVDPERNGLVGSWIIMPGSIENTENRMLTFTADGEYLDHAGRPPHVRIHASGEYVVVDGVLEFVDEPPLGMYAGGPFTIDGDILTLDYIGWGPADAPVELTMRLVRTSLW